MRALLTFPTWLYHRLDASLRARYLVPTTVLFTATLAGMVFAAAELHNLDLDNALRERGEVFADLVASGVNSIMTEQGPTDLTSILEAVQEHRPDVRSVSVLGPDGEVAYSSEPELRGVFPWGGPGPVHRTSLTPKNNPRQLAVVLPLENGPGCTSCHGDASQILGWVDVRFTRDSVIAAKDRLMRQMLLAAVPSLLVLLAISWWLLGREAVGPLHRLVGAMKKARTGDLDVSADEGRADELGQAARGFDEMLCALRKSRTELETLYQERLMRADRFALVGQMATGLAHEIKNPLAGLSGALELMAEDFRDVPKHSELVAEMRHQVDRMINVMEGMLSFARPQKPKMQPAEINKTIEKVLFLVRQQRNCTNVEIVRELGDDLPVLWADPGQLEQVFLNICLNALQAMGGKGTLTVTSRLRADAVEISIRDTGPGIPESVRPNLFKPFFTTRRDGNGLGLVISERVLADHGGSICFLCPPEGGTIFTVSLPAERQAREGAA